MMPWRRTPVAWLNLTYRWRRLCVAVGGIGFAVVLMFMEVGFQNALFDSTVQVVKVLNADIVLVSRARYTLTTNQTFDRSRLHLAESCSGVERAYPLYCEPYYALWRHSRSKRLPIRVLAFHLDDPVFLLSEIGIDRAALARLRWPQTAIVDTMSKPKYGFPTSAAKLNWKGGELSGQQLRLVGSFRMGTDFANDGNLIMGADNFRRCFPRRGRAEDPLQAVDFGVIKIQQGADAKQVTRALRRMLPRDVAVFTKQQFVRHEIAFWNSSTPIGFIFIVGTVMGFVVGVIICYQIIYTNNADHMSEFATLKAMGYRPTYFVGLVVCQALYLSVLGFAAGWLVSWGMYQALAAGTGLLMRLTVLRAATVFLMTLVMCAVSGGLAIRKVLESDPADLF